MKKTTTNQYRIEDHVVYILLQTGNECLIDENDWRLVSQYHCWENNRGYVQVWKDHKNVCLHKLLMPEQPYIDHVDRNKLNNRRSNLRPCTLQQNNYNTIHYKRSKTGYIGVELLPNGKYRSRVGYNNKLINAGIYDTVEEAALARDKLAIELHKQFAQLNNINKGDNNHD